ncbi:MAG: bacterioferritin-associated ferredoxin [Rhodomicrobium sp.]
MIRRSHYTGPGCMIVCSCNVLSDHEVREALKSPKPPRTPGRVHRHFGCKPRCGRCARSLCEIIAESGQGRPAVQLPETKVA